MPQIPTPFRNRYPTETNSSISRQNAPAKARYQPRGVFCFRTTLVILSVMPPNV